MSVCGMGLIAKSKNNSSTEGWGMGFFLVFFPEEQGEAIINNNSSKKSTKFTTINTLLQRTNSNHLLTKAQSTISICALLIFLTLILFTLSTFEPNSSSQFINARRHLSSRNYRLEKPRKFEHALQGLGYLYTRGTRAMADLVICHVPEATSGKELQLFLRLFHRSNLPARSDLIFIFPSASTSFQRAIVEETDSFLKLLHEFQQTVNGSAVGESIASFDVTQLLKSSKEAERADTIWGRKIRTNLTELDQTESTRTSYGSVASFVVGELDPEDSLAGFLDHVPMSLRRWACYPMLLGRVRRNFKHVMLVDVKDVLLLGDPLGRVRSRSPETVHVSTLPAKHGRRNSDKAHQKPINPAIIMGGARGIRRLSAAMLPGIVRAATASTQHKRLSPVTESGLLSQLVGNDYVLKNINLVSWSEGIPEVSALGGLRPGSRMGLLINHTVIWRGNSSIDIDAIIMKHICSFSLDSSVYSDC